jgi:hypothetical protein
MRAALAAVAFVSLAAGCSHLPKQAYEKDATPGYNRRELDDPRPGLFSGQDGAFTVYRNEADRAVEPPPPPAAKKRTTLLCARGETCDPLPP